MKDHQARLGENLYMSIEEIKINRIKNGKSTEKISTEKISNMIYNHKHWKEIKEKIENATEEEIEKYGK
jgi:hypothetical protein